MTRTVHVTVGLVGLLVCGPGASAVVAQPVHNLTQGTDHLTIQAAIDSAIDGDEIEVDPGTYVENIDFLDKDISLHSTDPLDPTIVAGTIIDGGQIDTVVVLSAGTLRGFTITEGSSAQFAGGVYATGTAVVSHNVITGNNGSYEGGGVLAEDSVVVSNNWLTNNVAWIAAGVHARDDSLIKNNYIASNIAIAGAGGIRARERTTIRNNTVVLNMAIGLGAIGPYSGGGIYSQDSAVLLSNIVAFSGDGWGMAGSGSGVTADYNCVFGNVRGDYLSDFGIGPHDLNVDPLLNQDNLHLTASSPCLDSGDPDLDPSANETDIDGEERILNDRVDNGCDEFAVCEGDANGDGLVDPLDSGFVLARFGCPVGTGDPSCDAADQNGDGVVDPLDNGFVLARFGDCL